MTILHARLSGSVPYWVIGVPPPPLFGVARHFLSMLQHMWLLRDGHFIMKWRELEGKKPGSPMWLRGRHEVSEKRFGGNQNKGLGKAGGEKNCCRRMNLVWKRSRDSALMALSQRWGPKEGLDNAILGLRIWVNVCDLQKEEFLYWRALALRNWQLNLPWEGRPCALVSW